MNSLRSFHKLNPLVWSAPRLRNSPEALLVFPSRHCPVPHWCDPQLLVAEIRAALPGPMLFPLGDIWQGLETFLIVTVLEAGLLLALVMETGAAVKQLTVHRTGPHNKELSSLKCQHYWAWETLPRLILLKTHALSWASVFVVLSFLVDLHVFFSK